MELFYYILGPRSQSDSMMYWSNTLGWVEDIEHADEFPIDILTVPLPIGSVGIIPFHSNGCPEGSYYKYISPMAGEG
jgi:hypothetical protein